ncbi:MAG: hypothetical protein ACI857_001296 [Arenicella sp.]|jgi:hypothetical protein
MKIKSLLFLSVLMAFSSNNSYSQNSDLGNWWIYFGNKKLIDKFNIHHEVQYRNYTFIGNTEQLLLRAGLGYNLSDNNNNLLLGYGFIHSQNFIDTTDTKLSVNEHRIYQQFITKQSFGRLSIQHRYRLEERFMNGFFQIRFRYFLAAKLALNKKKVEKGALYLSAYNEIFVRTQGQFFDRNRVYGGLGFVAMDNLKFELGYMNQFFQGSGRDQINVIGSFSF